MLALGIVELVRTVDGNRKPDAEDSAHIKAHRCGLRPEMNVDVMKALLLHPYADHQRFEEVHEVVEQPLQVQTTQAKHQSNPAAIASKIRQ